MKQSNIRNFCIIAHVDHGKSTLADRFLETTRAVPERRMKEQYLDQMALERERGITIKMAPVRMTYGEYILNLIDTPGHSDFSYEVSRALQAVEGGILLVDGKQGIQAQTLSHFQTAKEAGLTIIPAINKVDLFASHGDLAAELDELRSEIAELTETSPDKVYLVSGKTGQGVEELLRAVVHSVPCPKETAGAGGAARALIFDSFYDNHQGIIASVRVFNGSFKEGQAVRFLASKSSCKAKEVGWFTPELRPAEAGLGEGDIGYIATGLKDPDAVLIGDTVTLAAPGAKANIPALPGYEKPQSRMFASLFPEDADGYEKLKTGLERLRLNDAALMTLDDRNELLGRGFRVGFLGQLHYEITTARLAEEFGAPTLRTFPSVAYRVKEGDVWQTVTAPEAMPLHPDLVEEPIVDVRIIAPPKYMRSVMALHEAFRGEDMRTETVGKNLHIRMRIPLAEVVENFEDRLKSVTEGFGSFSYTPSGYAPAGVVRTDVLVSGERVPGLSRVLPKEKAVREGRRLAETLKKTLPRAQYVQAIQITSAGEIIAREDVPALKKNVTSHLYGGDRTRKMKLWQKQKRGKKRLLERGGKLSAKVSKDLFSALR